MPNRDSDLTDAFEYSQLSTTPTSMTLLELLIRARYGFNDWAINTRFVIDSAPTTNDIVIVDLRFPQYDDLRNRLKSILTVSPTSSDYLTLSSVMRGLGLSPGGEPRTCIDHHLIDITVTQTSSLSNAHNDILFQAGSTADGKPLVISLGLLQGARSLVDYGILGSTRLVVPDTEGFSTVETLVFRPEVITTRALRFVFDLESFIYKPLAMGQDVIYKLPTLDTNSHSVVRQIINGQPTLFSVEHIMNKVVGGVLSLDYYGLNDLEISGMTTLRYANQKMLSVLRHCISEGGERVYDYFNTLLTWVISYRWNGLTIANSCRVDFLRRLINNIGDNIHNRDSVVSFDDMLESSSDESHIERWELEGFARDMFYKYHSLRNTIINSDSSVVLPQRNLPSWFSSTDYLMFTEIDMLSTRTILSHNTDDRGERPLPVRGVHDQLYNEREDYEIPDWDGDEDDNEDEEESYQPAFAHDGLIRIRDYHSSSMRTNVGDVDYDNFKRLDDERLSETRDYIGLELEFAHDGGLDDGNYTYARQRLDTMVSKDMTIMDHFDFSNDSSLDWCGAEMVSLPMSYCYILSKREMFDNIFKEMNDAKMLSKGGFHIHFGRDLIDEILRNGRFGDRLDDYNERLYTIDALFDNLFYDAKTLDNGTNGGRATFGSLSTYILGRNANPYCEKNTNFHPMWSGSQRSHRNWLSVNSHTFELRIPSIPFSADDFYLKLHFIVKGMDIILDYMRNDYPKGVDKIDVIKRIRHHIVDCFEEKVKLVIEHYQSDSDYFPSNTQIPFHTFHRNLTGIVFRGGELSNTDRILRELTIILNLGDVFRNNSINYDGYGNDNNGYIGESFKALGSLIDNGVVKIGVKIGKKGD